MSTHNDEMADRLIEEVKHLRHDIARHVQIAAEQAHEVEELRADLAAKDATLGEMTALARKAEADLAAAQRAYEITRQDCWNLTEKVIPNIRQDLAAARALLLEARGWLDPWESRQSALRDRIDAALAGEKK